MDGEVAFVTADDHHGRGLASLLLSGLWMTPVLPIRTS